MRVWRGFGDLRAPLLAATVLHLAVVGWFARQPEPPTVVAPPADVVEIDVAAATDSPARGAPAAMPMPATLRATTVTSALRVAPSIAGATPVVTAEPRTEWVVPTGRIDLAVPRGAFAQGGAFELPPASTRDPAAPTSPSQTGGLVEGLDGRDIDVGLGRGGPVRAAVDAAAHDPSAPTFGMAVFAVSVLDSGKIHVDVLDANTERAGWEKLAPLIVQGLADKTVKIPGSAHGMRVTVKVEASEQFPGGARPVPPEKQGVTAGATFFKVHETKKHISIELPSAHVGYVGRKCGADLSVTPGALSVTGGCAVGVAMRVVETHLVHEERL